MSHFGRMSVEGDEDVVTYRIVPDERQAWSGFLNVAELKATAAHGMLPAPEAEPAPVMFERRANQRRTLDLVPEGIERKSDRRDEERRISPRVARRLWVVDEAEGGVPKVFEGEVGLGGASWSTLYPPLSKELQVRFRVPDHDEELTATAKIARTSIHGDQAKVQVVFTDLPLKHELALARYLDDCVLGH